MTLRDYFAARAPSAPDWFKHKATSSRPVIPAPPVALTTEQRADLGFANDEGDDYALDPVVRRDIAERQAAEQELQRWREEQREAKFFAWRWHYADMMLAERDK